MPAQNNMGWAPPYGFQLYAPQFMQGQPFFGAFPPQTNPLDSSHAGVADSNLHGQMAAPAGEGEQMPVDGGTNSLSTGGTQDGRLMGDSGTRQPMTTMPIAGPSRRAPAREPGSRRRWGDSASEEEDDDNRASDDKKGKKKVSWHDVQANTRQEQRDREQWEVEDRQQAVESEPIPWDVIEMQECELANVGTAQVGDPVAALQSQLTLNLDLMKKYNKLERLISKRQHSPHNQGDGMAKRHKEERKKLYDTRQCASDELDRFLEDGEEEFYRPQSGPP